MRHRLDAMVCALLLGVPSVAMVGCGDGGYSGGGDTVEGHGSARLALTLPDGSEVTTVTWEISGGELSAPMAGAIAVDDPNDTISALIRGIPAGSGYTITLAAVSDAGTECLGSAEFAVEAGQTTLVTVLMNCGGGEAGGNVLVNAEINQCPVIQSISAAPLEVAVGDEVALAALATDPDDDQVSYEWASTSGSFADTTAAATAFTCDTEGTAALSLTVDDGHACDVATNIEVLCVSDDDPTDDDSTDDDSTDDDSTDDDLDYYTFGHADLGFEFDFDESTGEFDVHLHIAGGTVNGVANVSGDYDLATARIVSDAQYTRPDDGGFFAPLCVEINESVYWLPQTNGSSSSLGVPFLGIAAEMDPGVFVGDQLDLTLVSVGSPSGSGHYALWKDGFPPDFSMSSCDGIDSSDSLSLPIGHDHFNHGFTEAGDWAITYEVSGELVSDGSTAAAQFTVNYIMED